jgi:DNA helicase II / ATP-dependent DNA helicase PcrA
MHGDSNTLLQGLNQRQLEAVQTVVGETLVIAGAGSGKTAVLTRRVANLIKSGEEPGSILCLTFTNKAAAEMNHRLKKLLAEQDIYLPYTQPWMNDYVTNPLLCTFHSLGVKILREFGELINLRKEFSILDPDDQEKIIKNILKEMRIDPKVISPKICSYFISLCKQELLNYDQTNKLPQDFPQELTRIYKKYQQLLEQNQAVDFDDLIFKTYQLLAEKVEVVQTLNKRWRHIMVDEFQDTNYAQFEIIKLLYPV